VSSDLELNAVLDRVLASARAHWEEDLRQGLDDVAKTAATDTARAVEQAVSEAVAREKDQAARDLLTVRREAGAEAAALRERADSRIEELRTLLDTTQRAKAASDETLSNTARELDELRVQAAAARAEVDATREAVDAAVRARSEQIRMADAGALWVLMGAARELDESRSLGDVLDCLTRSARRIVEGTSVYLVVDEGLHEWKPSLGVNGSSAGSRAWPRSAEPEEQGTFAVRVGGAVVAVVFVSIVPADDDARSWSNALSLLTRHAGLVLESMTLRRSAGFLLHPAAMSRVPEVSAGNAR
jgi:hypothetical protein